ncbi:MAG: Mrp/NBP35 family ATP-binding protein [Planctomycetota bacterium]|nr:Mrp/NBP35 family ATP-binding protein [Planctomycetota bacterium]
MALALNQVELEKFAGSIKDPETGRKIGNTGQLSTVQIDGMVAKLRIGLTSHSAPIRDNFVRLTTEQFLTVFEKGASLEIELFGFERPAPKTGQIGLTVKSVIAVGSGKGGVGKSTVAATLALGLKKAGCKVGLCDADIYGPSIPTLLGIEGQPSQVDGKIQPLDYNGMPVMSIGFLVPPEQAVVWRGPMLHSAMTQFLRDTNWGDLDYLIIDMPPGTGDIALSLSQMIPLTGSVVVCTPQKVALLDAIKAVAMFQKVNIPVLGVVENMSGFICPDTEKRYDIFGKGGAKRFAEEVKVPFLGDIPLNMQIRINGDDGAMENCLDDEIVGPSWQHVVFQLSQSLADKYSVEPPKASLPVLG